MENKFTFGPVPSRRLGRSLGIDLVPFKTCSYDCIYCQLGRTTNKTIERKEHFPVDEILKGLEKRLHEISPPDYITLAGSGEPSLYSPIKELIRGIKAMTDIRVALLTNGSLFWMDGIREAVLEADLIIPSLDAGDEDTFLTVNRPHDSISFSKMAEGLCALRESFTGALWLEVFLAGGITDTESEIVKLKKWADRINPDWVQLNTAVRTPAEDFVRTVSEEKMEEIAAFMGSHAEVIADYSKVHDRSEFHLTQDDVYNLLKRRPCSLDDISKGLELHRNETIKYVQELMDQDLIRMEKRNDTKLYVVNQKISSNEV